MITQKWISRLLAGASGATLAIARIGRAAAASTIVTTGGHVPFTVPANTNWVFVHGADLSTFTNGKTIANGNENVASDPQGDQSIGVAVDSSSLISSFINLASGK